MDHCAARQGSLAGLLTVARHGHGEGPHKTFTDRTQMLLYEDASSIEILSRPFYRNRKSNHAQHPCIALSFS